MGAPHDTAMYASGRGQRTGEEHAIDMTRLASSTGIILVSSSLDHSEKSEQQKPIRPNVLQSER